MAFEAVARCRNTYDPVTYFDAEAASVFHPKARSEIVRCFLINVRNLVNRLHLDVEMTRYNGEYGRGGTAYGRIELNMSTAEILERVEAFVSIKCGVTAKFEDTLEEGYILDWCLECVEIADAGDIHHSPEGNCADAIAARMQESGVVLECFRAALNTTALELRLSDPDEVVANLKYRARAIHF